MKFFISYMKVVYKKNLIFSFIFPLIESFSLLPFLWRGLDAALIRNIGENLSRSHKSKETLTETTQILKGLRNKVH